MTITLHSAVRKAIEAKGYKIGKPIGQGGSGSVFLIYSEKYNQNFVCKCLLKEKTFTANFQFYFENEISSLQKLSHPHIVSLYDYFVVANTHVMIMEYCERGNALRTISLHVKRDPLILLQYAKEIVSGLCYCHAKEIVHLDLKPTNILIDKYQRLKIADFGLSQHVKYGEKINKYHGTMIYMPPEMLKKKPYDPYKADIWSFGVTLYQIACGKLPWHQIDPQALLSEIQLGIIRFSSKVPHCLRPIISACLRVNPEDRPNTNELEYMINNVILARKSTIVQPKPINQHSPSSSLNASSSLPFLHQKGTRKLMRIPYSSVQVALLPPIHPNFSPES